MMTTLLNTIYFPASINRPLKEMIEEIKAGKSLCFGAGKLQELCKLLPDEGEVLESAYFVV